MGLVVRGWRAVVGTGRPDLGIRTKQYVNHPKLGRYAPSAKINMGMREFARQTYLWDMYIKNAH